GGGRPRRVGHRGRRHAGDAGCRRERRTGVARRPRPDRHGAAAPSRWCGAWRVRGRPAPPRPRRGRRAAGARPGHAPRRVCGDFPSRRPGGARRPPGAGTVAARRPRPGQHRPGAAGGRLGAGVDRGLRCPVPGPGPAVAARERRAVLRLGPMPAPRQARAFIALLAVLVAAATAACRGGGAGRQATGTTAAGSNAAGNRPDINPVRRDDLPDGGTLRWPLASFPPNFNVGELDGTSADTANVVDAMLPSMFGFDSGARPTIDRDYLDSAELTARDPRQVVTYRINPKAAWDDGTPITEADFEAQWKALSGSNPAYRIASSSGYEQIDSVARGADDRSVVVTFRRPYADW